MEKENIAQITLEKQQQILGNSMKLCERLKNIPPKKIHRRDSGLQLRKSVFLKKIRSFLARRSEERMQIRFNNALLSTRKLKETFPGARNFTGRYVPYEEKRIIWTKENLHRENNNNI